MAFFWHDDGVWAGACLAAQLEVAGCCSATIADQRRGPAGYLVASCFTLVSRPLDPYVPVHDTGRRVRCNHAGRRQTRSREQNWKARTPLHFLHLLALQVSKLLSRCFTTL